MNGMEKYSEQRAADRKNARIKMIECARRIIEIGRKKEGKINNLLLIDEASRLGHHASDFRVKRECHIEDANFSETEDL